MENSHKHRGEIIYCIVRASQRSNFEEFEIGQQLQTVFRTITESDVITFAGLSGDLNQPDTGEEFAGNTAFARRIVHGLPGMTIASDITIRGGVLEGTALASREINNWKFSNPIFSGDTIHVELEVNETKSLPQIRSVQC